MRKNKGLYPRTTELISGIDYCIRKALKFNRPLVLNISFGNNYGSHTGNSLSELYLNRVSLLGRISIIAASGNEGTMTETPGATRSGFVKRFGIEAAPRPEKSAGVFVFAS